MRVSWPMPCLVAALALGCRASPHPTPTSSVEPASAGAQSTTDPTDTSDAEAGLVDAREVGPPTRWEIDGTSMAEDRRVLPAHARALRAAGRRLEDIQDRVLVDLNGDGHLDALVLLPALEVAGAYDVVVLLSTKGDVRVHVLADLVDEAIFSAAVVPLVDGPTLIATAPRLGSCERGPSWSFLRATGDLLEAVGRLVIEPYDCATATGEIAFVREPDGQVARIELRHGERVEVQRWDPSLGAFTP